MTAARASFMALLDSDRSQFIYGTTSGAGQQAAKSIPAAEQRKRAKEFGRPPKGAGFGRDTLPERMVRMILFARLANYIEGHAKTRPVEAERIASMLERPLPKVPLSGQVGAGEILPLFHVMNKIPAGNTEEAEPMARVNGSPVSAALVADVALTARARLALTAKVFALSVEGYQAPLEPYDKDLKAIWSQDCQQAALKALNRWLTGTARRKRMSYQAPVSYRILPTVLAAAQAALTTAEEVANISLASVTDNPVYILPDAEHALGRVFSTGGYHNAQATPAIDTLNARYADLCTLADRHTLKLHSAEHLPENLAKPGTSVWGTTLFGFVQVGYGEEARHAAQRTFMPPSEGGGVGGQNDVAVATTLAYKKHQQAAFCLEAALALLAVSASQALWACNRKSPPRLADFLELIRDYVPPLTTRGKRDLGRELHSLQNAFADLALAQNDH